MLVAFEPDNFFFGKTLSCFVVQKERVNNMRSVVESVMINIHIIIYRKLRYYRIPFFNVMQFIISGPPKTLSHDRRKA